MLRPRRDSMNTERYLGAQAGGMGDPIGRRRRRGGCRPHAAPDAQPSPAIECPHSGATASAILPLAPPTPPADGTVEYAPATRVALLLPPPPRRAREGGGSRTGGPQAWISACAGMTWGWDGWVQVGEIRLEDPRSISITPRPVVVGRAGGSPRRPPASSGGIQCLPAAEREARHGGGSPRADAVSRRRCPRPRALRRGAEYPRPSPIHCLNPRPRLPFTHGRCPPRPAALSRV